MARSALVRRERRSTDSPAATAADGTRVGMPRAARRILAASSWGMILNALDGADPRPDQRSDHTAHWLRNIVLLRAAA